MTGPVDFWLTSPGFLGSLGPRLREGLFLEGKEIMKFCHFIKTQGSLFSVFSILVILFAAAPVVADEKTGAVETCQSLLSASHLEDSVWEGSIVVLDTNVLVDNPYSPFQFPGAEVVIPLQVLQELDKLKTGFGVSRDSSAPQQARAASAVLEDLLDTNNWEGHIFELENGSVLKFAHSERGVKELFKEAPGYLDPTKMDDQILMVARDIRISHPDKQVFLITNDINLKFKAKAEGLKIPTRRQLKVLSQNNKNYSGVEEYFVSGQRFFELSQKMAIPRGEFLEAEEHSFYANQFVVIRSEEDPELVLLGRYDPDRDRIRLLKEPPANAVLQPRNLEQELALDILRDPRIPIVTIQGKAGTGKTLLALAAGLEQTSPLLTKSPRYSQIFLTRPTVNVDDEKTGFLPGGEKEKIAPLMAPFFDNLETLSAIIFGGGASGRVQRDGTKSNWRKEQRRQIARINQAKHENGGKLPEDFDGPSEVILPPISKGDKEALEEQSEVLRSVVHINTIAYFRGRSLVSTYIIVDEAQNLTLHQIKTLVTRAGEGTKIVLMGDLDQVDRAMLRGSGNGFSRFVDAFKGSSFAAHITLNNVERSPMVKEATEIFESLGL